jgi:acyl-CoA synthetase (AMP-forming)/AMP-acid ligase II
MTAPGGTLPARFVGLWSHDPSAAALIDGRDGTVVTAAELEDSSGRLAAELLRGGLASGERVLWSPDEPVGAAIAAVAVLRAGLVLVPVNPGLTAPELRHVISEAQPAASLIDDAALAHSVAEIDPKLVAVAAGAAGARGSSRPEAGGLDAARPSDPALILFTSGTTGKPKGAAHTHASLLANAESLRQAWRWEPDDRLVHALPLFHAHGLCVGLFGTLHVGGSAVLLPRFGVEDVLGAPERFGASMFFGVPTMYHRLAESGRAAELGALRLAVSGSAALPAALHRAIAAASGAAILERYGTTETLMSLSNPWKGERRAGTVGLPLPGVEIRLAAPELTDGADAGSQTGTGASSAGAGELLVRSPSVFSGYFGRPEATAEAFADGWYRTGDVAAVAPDGYVSILGRTKELVISGGFNVYPAEVEGVIAEHAGVAEVAVTGTPSDEWGEVVTAWIVPAAGAGEALVEAVSEFAAQRLAPYKRPRIIRIVETLPRNALGKVVKHRLGQGP